MGFAAVIPEIPVQAGATPGSGNPRRLSRRTATKKNRLGRNGRRSRNTPREHSTLDGITSNSANVVDRVLRGVMFRFHDVADQREAAVLILHLLLQSKVLHVEGLLHLLHLYHVALGARGALAHRYPSQRLIPLGQQRDQSLIRLQNPGTKLPQFCSGVCKVVEVPKCFPSSSELRCGLRLREHMHHLWVR